MRTQLQSNRLKTNSTVSITVELPADDAKLVTLLAEMSGKTEESLIKKFIGDGAEDMGDVIIAKDATEGIRLGRDRVYTQEEARIELELDD